MTNSETTTASSAHQRFFELVTELQDAAIACAAVPAKWTKFERDDESTWPPDGVRVCVWLEGRIHTGYPTQTREGKWLIDSSEGRRNGILWCFQPEPPPEMKKDSKW